jgi:hypothetical protein
LVVEGDAGEEEAGLAEPGRTENEGPILVALDQGEDEALELRLIVRASIEERLEQSESGVVAEVVDQFDYPRNGTGTRGYRGSSERPWASPRIRSSSSLSAFSLSLSLSPERRLIGRRLRQQRRL